MGRNFPRRSWLSIEERVAWIAYSDRANGGEGQGMIFAVNNSRARRRTVAWRYVMTLISGPVIGIAYCCAARQDERDGYTITAALEWRWAAELMAPIPSAADRCWTQWERLMRLPRRMAGPIAASREAVHVMDVESENGLPSGYGGG
jgi:hypothetical protein